MESTSGERVFCRGTAVLVPDVLLEQWTQQVYTHISRHALRNIRIYVAPRPIENSDLPCAQELACYDLLLIPFS